MRLYLEASEIIPELSLEESDFIRADITDKADAEVAEIKALIQEIMAGKQYSLTRHFCEHDEGKSCKTEKAV